MRDVTSTKACCSVNVLRGGVKHVSMSNGPNSSSATHCIMAYNSQRYPLVTSLASFAAQTKHRQRKTEPSRRGRDNRQGLGRDNGWFCQGDGRCPKHPPRGQDHGAKGGWGAKPTGVRRPRGEIHRTRHPHWTLNRAALTINKVPHHDEHGAT